MVELRHPPTAPTPAGALEHLAQRSCASRSKRARRSGSAVKAGGRTLTATSRRSFESVARHTSPMPPSPSLAVTS
jgi:hypothetical protein